MQERVYIVQDICLRHQNLEAWITRFYVVSVHQMVPPQTKIVDIKLQPTTHLSTPKGWKAELAWLADL